MIRFYQFHHPFTKKGELLIKSDHSSPRIDKEMAASLLEQRAAENSLSLPLTTASTMSNSESTPSRSLDVTGTKTVNADRYQSPNARLRLNGQGLPIAIRRVVALQQPGSPATRRYQVVKPNGVVGLSHVSLSSWEEKRSHPVN